jgi:hypothetical protein
MTVCRAFTVRSRSRQPPLSICNLLRQVTTSCHTPRGGLSATPTREGACQSSTAPELSIQKDPGARRPCGRTRRLPAYITIHASFTLLSIGGSAPGGVPYMDCLYGLSRRCAWHSRSAWTRIQHPTVRGVNLAFAWVDRIRPLSATSNHGLIATTTSRMIEESTRCSKSRYGPKSNGSRPAAAMCAIS